MLEKGERLKNGSLGRIERKDERDGAESMDMKERERGRGRERDRMKLRMME